jgi:diaminopimelate decarboxylase
MDKTTFYSLITSEHLQRAIQSVQTPSYIYFGAILRHQIERVRNCTGGRFHIHYAVKANPNAQILSEMATMGIGADVASSGELLAAKAAGVSGDSIEFSGPGKQADELALAIESEIASINIENLQEIDAIKRICEQTGRVARVGIRINPGAGNVRAGMRMAGDTQFGLPYPDVLEALKSIEAASGRIEFTGLHAHFASQELDAKKLAENFRTLLRLASELASQTRLPIRKLNFGGGWGIKYFSNQSDLDLAILADELASILDSAERRALPEDMRLVVEPGRFLVGECGVFVTQVLYRKASTTKEFLITDGGMNANYILAGGMGQVIRRNFEMDVIPTTLRHLASSQKFDVAGPLCTPQDVLATGFESDQDVRPGDSLVFFNCGAYGPSASPVNFLSHRLPAESFIPA